MGVRIIAKIFEPLIFGGKLVDDGGETVVGVVIVVLFLLNKPVLLLYEVSQRPVRFWPFRNIMVFDIYGGGS